MGERAGFYDNEIVVIALVVTIIVLFTSLIWWNADVINRLEAQQQYAVERQRESQQAYQLIAENTSELITLIDGQGHIIYASPSYLPTLGYHPEEVQRINMNVYVHPDDLAGTRAEFRQLFERGRAQSILRYRHADSSWRWIEISGTHVVQQDRVFALIVGRDVTARKQMEDELREREYSYRTLLEQASDGIFVTNAQGDYITVNPRACEMLGYSESELLQMNVRDVLPPGETSRAPLRIDEIRAGHTVVHERQFLRKDGSRFPVEISAKVLNDGRMQGIVRDITERKRLESQLLQAQKMEGIGQLAGGIAHDFNNLLTVISGYADFVREALPPDDPTLADIDEIRKAAQRASSLTQQLLAFARKQVIEPYVINLNTLILNMEKLLRRLIGEDVDLVALPAPDLGQVRVDPGQIEQVIMNLAVNARDAMPDGGQLTIETANVVLDANYARRHISVVPGEYVLIAVSDTGSGMDEATQQHIFEPFFTTKAPGHGTGLGLATCYGIVKQHGGNIWLYSELGQGTTFKIYLPRVDEPPVDVFHRNERRWHGGSETVLIVEDEVAVRTLAVRALREHGYQVIEASNGSEALQLVRAQQTATIDLLLTDVVMPQMGGKALVAQLTEIYPQLKVLFVSGYAASAIVQHGQLEPNTMFLQKPFSPTSIVRKVREVLDGTS
jgi:PAS domain S-box-containing protein